MMRSILITALSMFIIHAGFAQKKNMRTKNNDTIAMIQTTIPKAESSIEHSGSPLSDVNTLLGLYKKNVFFYGFNQENHWELLIKEDSSFIFVSNNDTLIFQYAKFTQAQDASVIRYHSKTQVTAAKQDTTKKNITITISEQKNIVDSVPAGYPFKLNVVIGDQTEKSSAYFSGNGFYVVNPIINDIWVLDSLNKKPVQKALFPNGLPRLEFHLNDSKIYGFGGCNEFSGSFYAVQHQIHFNTSVKTLKFCIDASGEATFMPLLNNKRYTYSIQNLRLKLTSRDGTILVFKKVD